MFYTHHFSHHETLTKAHAWLQRLGYVGDHVKAHGDGVPRITLSVDPPRLAEVEMLISVAERSDPDGWPSFWETARLAGKGSTPAAAREESPPSKPRTLPIGWHPVDPREDSLPTLR